MTTTPSIATNTAPANDAGAASRAKTVSSDNDGAFDKLVGQSRDDAKDTQKDTQTDTKSDSAQAKLPKADQATRGSKAIEAASKGKLTDPALLAQLKLLGEKDGKADVAHNADDDTKMQPRGKGKTKDAQAVAVPTNAIMQQLLAKIPAQDQIRLAAGGKKTQPIQPRVPGEGAVDASKDGQKDGKDAADQLKALANPADTAKPQVAQATVAKALNAHVDGANAKDGNGQQGSDQKSGDQQNRNAKTGADTSPSPDLKQTAAQPVAAPQTPAHTQGPAQPAQPQQAPDVLAAASAPVSATQTAHPVSASLHVAAQSADVAPNLTSLAVNIVAKSKDGKKDFDIRLDPGELGRVDVKLSIDDAGKAQATLQAEKPHTLELLQRDRGTLERALRDAGLDLAGGGLNFSLKGQDKDGNSNTPSGRGRNLSVSAIADIGSAASLASTQIAPADSRLDIRV